ncbi:hypothetical protein CKF54_03640 [Psittacicella hinzii]|uniref:HTH lysR-type domain-containing protein n=1 Tax=Psittacicella hinzii TaxID=2028575 RepID=A0A3A1Y5Y1_9GAMM|nr:LysR family transcriptional regulator [Psittacicella hinzii]RIY33035.1 hypothetical protein CKF54_03640 [Psittacicella hinzii]
MKEHLSALYQFMWVAKLKSFSNAAERLNMAQSGISRSIKDLETYLKVKLINRTTRRLSLTPAGSNLFRELEEGFFYLDRGLQQLDLMRTYPTGKVTITASRQAMEQVLIPRLASFGSKYPDVELELIVDNSNGDVVVSALESESIDAGVRLGEEVTEGLVAVRISEDLEMAVVATPELLSKYGIPKDPKDLVNFPCIAGKLDGERVFDWEFKDKYKHKPAGSWTLNDSSLILEATRSGVGLAYEPKELVKDDLAKGKLIQVLQDYTLTIPGFYLYYQDREVSPALRVVIESLKV